jgi:hypothetical protein
MMLLTAMGFILFVWTLLFMEDYQRSLVAADWTEYERRAESRHRWWKGRRKHFHSVRDRIEYWL